MDLDSCSISQAYSTGPCRSVRAKKAKVKTLDIVVASLFLLARMREVDSSVLCPEKPHYRQQALQSKEHLRPFVHELMLPRAQRLAHHPVQSHAGPLLPPRFECVLRAMELSSYTTRGI